MRFPPKTPRLACGVLPVNLIKLFYIGTPVVRTDGRWADLRSRDFSDGWITKFSKEWGAAREHKYIFKKWPKLYSN